MAKMNSIRLSICIPTYNFGQFIGETLQSIVDQPNDDIEVIVLDGGSTDNTAQIVLGFQKISPQIIYHRLEKKGGIDNDMAKTVDLARGEYCWLMSSDDALKPGAILRVLEETKHGYDIYLCNRTDCDKRLKPVKDRQWLSNSIKDHVFNMSSPAELIHYLNEAQSIGALFSYMSSIIVRRDKWNGVKYDGRFTGSNYAHAFRLLSILKKSGTLKYIRDPLILCRGGNDSFLKNGLYNRCLIDLNGYHLLAFQLYPDGDVRHSFLAVMRRYYRWYDLVALKKLAPNKESWNNLENILIDYGYTRARLVVVRMLNSSRLVYAVAQYLWKIANILIPRP